MCPHSGPHGPVVSIFGSASPAPDSPAYEAARTAGRLLAEAGCRVQTGGYGGVMAAACRGAREAGGHAIGVTCDTIEAWRPGAANPWFAEERRQPTLDARLRVLIESCDAALVLPGGPGTLAEFALLWNRMQVGELEPRPLIAVGSFWEAVLEAFSDPAHVPAAHRALVRTAPDASAAVELLLAQLGRARGPGPAP